jgi:class 3 adenylate cyclase
VAGTKKPAIVPGSAEYAARKHAKKLADKLNFSSENLGGAENKYVAWLDLMGAGHLMATSMEKTANAISRIHTATYLAVTQHGYKPDLIGINDGIFICSPSKVEITQIVRSALIHLAARFVSKNDPQDRFLVRCAIAYGPTFSGKRLAEQLPGYKKGTVPATLDHVVFGPPVIQAYRAEHESPPYGVAVHESARSFAPETTRPFRSTLWRWWQPDDAGKFSKATPGCQDHSRTC